MLAVNIFLGLAPGFAWLFFYLREDLHPEPKRLILLTFLLGGLATFPAAFLQCAASGPFDIDCKDGEVTFAYLPVVALFVFAAIEEIVKFAAAYFAVHKRSAFNEPVDAMIYMVVASLGFATIENFAYVSTHPARLFTDQLELVALRFVGATLLHTLASAIIGYYWAVGIRRFKSAGPLLYGLVLGTGLHTIFNYLIINAEKISYAILLVAVAGFFVLSDFEKLKEKNV